MLLSKKKNSFLSVAQGRRLIIPILAIIILVPALQQISKVLYDSFGMDDPLSNQNTMFDIDMRHFEDILYANYQPAPGRTIFFHETSCYQKSLDFNVIQLTSRQACAIESAALNNPNFQVFLLFSCPTLNLLSGRQKLLFNAIQSYSNVQIRQLSIHSYATGTPIEEWVKRNEIQNSKYPIEHLSDLLRLISLYRYGGIYLDLDVLVLQSLENVQPNYVGGQNNVTLSNAVISLEPTGKGHEIAKLFLDHYQKHYNGENYSGNGPSLVTSVLLKFCGKSMIKVMQEGRKSCQGFRVFNSTAFYAILWYEWRHFTEPKYLDETMARTKDSYLIHIWNKVSYNTLIKVGSNTALGKYAEKCCPKTYAVAEEYF